MTRPGYLVHAEQQARDAAERAGQHMRDLRATLDGAA